MSLLKYITLVLTLIFGVTISSQGVAMSMLFPDKVVPFSGFEGQITENGVPVAGAKVRRIYNFTGTDVEDSVVTDTDGKFSFPTIWSKFRAPFFAQFVSTQRMFVERDDREVLVWGCSKLGEGEFFEFGGAKPVELVCKLDEELRRVELGMGAVGTNCYWD